MKKLILLVCLFVAAGISVNVMAQGTGIAPQIGETHVYSVTFTSGNTYQWKVTSDDKGENAVATTIATVANETTASVSVTWVNPTPGTTYYVHVIETSGSCSNHKAMAVTPANAFALQIVSVDINDDDADNGQNAALCAPDVTVASWNDAGSDGVVATIAEAQDFTYDFGTTTLYYKVTASGINTTNTAWSPQFTIATTNTSGANVSAEWATSIGGSYTTTGLDVDGGDNDITVPAGNASIWIKVVIDNGDSSAGLEGTTAQDVTVTLLDGANTSEDANGNDVTSIGNGNRHQVVSARPATSVISTDHN